MFHLFSRFGKDDSGATTFEHSILAVLIGLISFNVLNALSPR